MTTEQLGEPTSGPANGAFGSPRIQSMRPREPQDSTNTLGEATQLKYLSFGVSPFGRTTFLPPRITRNYATTALAVGRCGVFPCWTGPARFTTRINGAVSTAVTPGRRASRCVTYE